MFRTTALRQTQKASHSGALLRRWNHGRINHREAHYGFYDCIPRNTLSASINQVVSIQQTAGIGQASNPFAEKAAEAARDEEERQQQEEMAARMDEESGRTTSPGRPPTPIGGIIFGSRLAGPAARPPPAPETIRIVEGIKVPPRPDEPDNCCMS